MPVVTEIELLRERLSILLMDTTNRRWDMDTLEQSIMIAMADLAGATGTPQTLNLFQGAYATTITIDNKNILLVGAAAYAAQSRALNVSEKASLGQMPNAGLVEYGRDMMVKFRDSLDKLVERKAIADKAVVVAAAVAADAAAAAAKVAAEVEAARIKAAAEATASGDKVAVAIDVATAKVAADIEAAEAKVAAEVAAAEVKVAADAAAAAALAAADAAAIAAKAEVAAAVAAAAAAAAAAEQSRLSGMHGSTSAPYSETTWTEEPEKW